MRSIYTMGASDDSSFMESVRNERSVEATIELCAAYEYTEEEAVMLALKSFTSARLSFLLPHILDVERVRIVDDDDALVASP
mmetsp:Transcript_14173/g.20785  ORF Transcript_14173/g.20785 Transcript_14173/m.20785 type:complete len:82 (-) Transcript_14173:358-603(-)